MNVRIGVVKKSMNPRAFPWSVEVEGYTFFMTHKDANNGTYKENMPILVQYEPKDQFVHVLSFAIVENALNSYEG